MKALLTVLAVGLALLASACGGGVSQDRVQELERDVAALEERIGELEVKQVQFTPIPNPTPTPKPTPTPTPEVKVKPTPTPTRMGMDIMSMGPLQEIGLIENYAATRFFLKWMVVVRDIPVRIYLTRLHREHVNQFTIEPFYRSAQVILPGEIGVIKFLPDQVGKFKIRNVGHSFEATLVVVDSEAEERQRISERGVQMYSFIA